MMSIDLPDNFPDRAPSSRRPLLAAKLPPKRGAPCAGLFGWRKGGDPARCPQAGPDDGPRPDYPVG